jgi:hypothetical protein
MNQGRYTHEKELEPIDVQSKTFRLESTTMLPLPPPLQNENQGSQNAHRTALYHLDVP